MEFLQVDSGQWTLGRLLFSSFVGQADLHKGMVNIGNLGFSSLVCFENCWMNMTGSKLTQMWLLAATKLHCHDLRGLRLMKHGMACWIILCDTSKHASLRWCIVPRQPNSKLYRQFSDICIMVLIIVIYSNQYMLFKAEKLGCLGP